MGGEAVGILTSLFSRTPQASAGYNATHDFWYTEAGASTSSGESVTSDSALRVSTVFACVRVLAETLASLPCITYRRLSAGGKERATDHALYSLLHDQPNHWQTSFEWREMMMGHLVLRGNSYSEIIPGRRGSVDQLIPLHPDRVRPVRLSDGSIGYEVRSVDPGRAPRRLNQNQVFHLRGLSSDGIVGLNPIAISRETIGRAIAQQKHGSSLFKNGARPGGILRHPGQLKPEARRNLRNSWEQLHGGSANSGRVAILEEGMSWEAVGMTSQDAQFIENEQFSAVEICRIFRVPPYKVAHLQPGTVSFASVEQQAIDFVTDTARPWAVRWEQAFLRDLVSEPETYFVEFLFDALLRGDAESRARSLQTQFLNGALNQDEWREIENRNPLPEGQGKKFYVPLNITTIERLEALPMPENPPHDPPGPRPPKDQYEDDEDDTDARNVLPNPSAFAPLIRDAAERITRAEMRELEKRVGKAEEDRERFNTWLGEFYEAHATYTEKVLTPLVSAWSLVGGSPPNVGDFVRSYAAATADDLIHVTSPAAVVEGWQDTRTTWMEQQIQGGFFHAQQ